MLGSYPLWLWETVRGELLTLGRAEEWGECFGCRQSWKKESKYESSDVHVMLARCCRSRQVVMANEELHGTDISSTREIGVDAHIGAQGLR